MSESIQTGTPQEIITVVATTIGMLSSILTVVLLFQMTSTLNFFKDMFEKIYSSSSKIQSTTEYMQQKWDTMITSSSNSIDYIKNKWESVTDISSVRSKTSNAISSIGDKISNLKTGKSSVKEDGSNVIPRGTEMVHSIMNSKK